MIQKTILFSALFFLFGLAPHALAQGFTALAPIPGLTDQSPTAVVNSATLAAFFNNLYKYCLGLAAVLAVIMITWGGLRIATNQDNVSVIIDSKGKIYNAIYGLILVLSPVLVFSIINPAILNLSIGLSPIDFTYAPIVQTQTAPYTPSAIETADLPEGVRVLFSFEAVWDISPSEMIRILNEKQSECTRAAGGPGIILPTSLQTTRRTFACRTCGPGLTATPRSTCSRQNTTFVCGSCN